MKQTSFSDIEFASKKRLTRRERFLAEIEAATPWPALVAALLPHYPKGDGRGRPPIGLERMLRMYIAQQCLGLSDEGIEDAIYDIQSVRNFVGIDLTHESAPDATTLLKFRRLLEANDLTHRVFNEINGHLASKGLKQSSLTNSIGGELLREGYTYDKLGNVKTRSQYWQDQGFSETFEYDSMNRLWKSTIGAATQTFTYDDIGNIKTKSGVGTGEYSYVGRPHAVSSIPGIAGTFEYDDNGNLTLGAGRTVSWTSFDMPLSITNGSSTSSFVYGPEHQRTRQIKDGANIYYAGAMEVELDAGGATKSVKTYWPQGLGVEIDVPGQETALNWTHLDRLGSVVAISNAAGTVVEKLAYDSWGKRRNLTDNGTPNTTDGVTDNKGFTGHEMLDKLDLVHMNGRVYDPFVARFMSADPIIQDPTHSQSYNRYTYVWNNPTNLTDPTGFIAQQEWIDRDLQRGSDRCASMGGNCSLVGATGYEHYFEPTSNEVSQTNTAEKSPAAAPGPCWWRSSRAGAQRRALRTRPFRPPVPS